MGGQANESIAAAALAKIVGLSKKSVIARANRENWPYREEPHAGQPRRLYTLDELPQEIQKAVILHTSFPDGADSAPASTDPSSHDGDRVTSPAGSVERPATVSYSSESLWARFDRLPAKAKQQAERRLRAIEAALKLIDTGLSARQAWTVAAEQIDSSRASIQRWHGNLMRSGILRDDWLAALAPRYVGKQKSTKISPEAWDYFCADYLRPERPTFAACYERLEQVSAERGWTILSARTMQKRVAEIPIAQRILMREGEAALMQRYPSMHRSVSSLYAGQWINGDGYQHNVFVRWSDGTIARPKTWVWQDVYSRKILTWRTDQTEHTDVIRQSVGDLIQRYGIPEHVTIDNTRAAANKWMTGGIPHRYRFKVKEDDPDGLFKTLGIKVHWTSVFAGKGHGQAKPVERAFGIGGLGEIVDKHPSLAGAHTGKDTTDKPDNYGSKAIDLADFVEVLAQGIRAFNAREGRRTEICAGRLSFDDAFRESHQTAPIKKANAQQRRLFMLTAESRRVDRTGSISLDAGGATGLGRNRYFCEAMAAYIGKKVIARFDPQRLHESVFIYTLDNRYIGEAACVLKAGFGDTEAGLKHNRARRQWVRATKAAAEAQLRMTVEEAARLLPDQAEPDPVEPQVVRPLFGRAVGSDIEDEGDEHDQMFSRAVRQMQVPNET